MGRVCTGAGGGGRVGVNVGDGVFGWWVVC